MLGNCERTDERKIKQKHQQQQKSKRESSIYIQYTPRAQQDDTCTIAHFLNLIRPHFSLLDHYTWAPKTNVLNHQAFKRYTPESDSRQVRAYAWAFVYMGTTAVVRIELKAQAVNGYDAKMVT